MLLIRFIVVSIVDFDVANLMGGKCPSEKIAQVLLRPSFNQILLPILP